MKRLIAALLTICMLVTCFNLAVFANNSNEDNQNVVSPAEPWIYSPNEKQETPTRTTTSPSASDTVIVTVEATDKATGEKVPVEGATVCLYVGAERRDTSEKTAADGTTTISLKGLSYTERSNATISAYKAVSSGKAIDGTARDDLFKHFGDGKDYIRYTMELHSETIDENGNWLGAPLPLSYESNKVDIVFAIDATGSMGDEINNVRNNIAAFSDSLLNRGLDARFCIIDYRDITEGERTVKHTANGSHWVREMPTITDILSNIKVEGGGDGPETAIDALGMIASPETMQWRSDAYKFAFVLTDADYKVNNNYGFTSLEDVSLALKDMDISVSVITDNSHKNDYTTLLETTNGIYANIYGDFESEMLNLAESVVDATVREMTLTISEPRMLVNLSVCYFADDRKSQSQEYENAVKNVLNEYSKKLAEATDGHVLIDRILLFSTSNRSNFYDTNRIESMADIRIESEVDDDGKWLSNVKISTNAYANYFYSAQPLATDLGSFHNLKTEIDGRETFGRIQISGTTYNHDHNLIDHATKYSAAIAHETGHYIFGFFDEYLDANGDYWNSSNRPYAQFGFMDDVRQDVEMSKDGIDYKYTESSTAYTYHWNVFRKSCESTLADLLTTGNTTYNSSRNHKYGYYELPDDGAFEKHGDNADYGKYKITYSLAGSSDRRATYSYAELNDSDFLSPYNFSSGGGNGGGGGSAGGRSASRTKTPAEATFTNESVATATFVSKDNTVVVSILSETDCVYTVSFQKSGDEGFTEVVLSGNKAILPISKDEMAEVRITAVKDDSAKYNAYYIDRSPSTSNGYLYSSADNASMAYVITDTEESYTFVADNTRYTNGDYFSVNQATRISSDNGVGFDSGEIYSVASCMAEIDYTTLTWFKYADGKWTALKTDYSTEENMNIGARADLDGEGLYILMAKAAPTVKALPAENLAYTQSTDRDAVVTLTFDDPNTNSKYYNVYYSETPFSNKNAEDVVIRSFDAETTSLTINLLERGRTVYAAVEIVLEDGSRSELSEIILIGGEADSDGDGIPDWYCDKYFLWGEDGEDKDIANSDDDNDGLTNYEEFIAGSDPTDPNDPVHTTNVPVESIALSSSELHIKLGEKASVQVIVLPENATNKVVTWRSANETIATVEVADGACYITAVAIGKTEIFAVTSDGGYSAKVSVVVYNNLPFDDVVAEAWYANAVKFVYENNIMFGVSASKFDPEGFVTRGMVVTVLHRMEGTPAADAEGFTDVAAGLWYTNAILWAQENGIVEGYGDGTFQPDKNITREEMIAVFYRYATYKGYDVSKRAMMTSYTDRTVIQSYAEDAMSWAVSIGLIKGFPDGTIRPDAYSTRAQLAEVLMRFDNLFIE